MLKEWPNVRQLPGEPRRRLFGDDYLQLCVWFDLRDRVTGFELSYDLAKQWRALRWELGKAAVHYRVDAGEGRAFRKASPVLIDDRSSVSRVLDHDFQRRAKTLPATLAELVHEQLRAYLATFTG
jgi:hypothetical protein